MRCGVRWTYPTASRAGYGSATTGALDVNATARTGGKSPHRPRLVHATLTTAHEWGGARFVAVCLGSAPHACFGGAFGAFGDHVGGCVVVFVVFFFLSRTSADTDTGNTTRSWRRRWWKLLVTTFGHTVHSATIGRPRREHHPQLTHACGNRRLHKRRHGGVRTIRATPRHGASRPCGRVTYDRVCPLLT